MELKHFLLKKTEDERVWHLHLEVEGKPNNQLDLSVGEELFSVLIEAARDPKLKVLVLRSGRKVFSTGADVDSFPSFSTHGVYVLSSVGQKIFTLLEELPVVTVCLVEGFALGGGFELALCCDFILATKRARFGFPEVNLGLLPGWGGTQRITKRVGRATALELVLTGEVISAQKAKELGIVKEILEKDRVEEELEKFISRFVSKGKNSIALIKKAVNMAERLNIYEGLDYESHLFARAWTTPEKEEGIKAYLEKRKPNFSDL